LNPVSPKVASASRPIRISAVIPTYNRDKTIARAIDSALAQHFSASELLVVDDGSSDNTRKIVETYGERVRYIFQPNAGVSAARNRCVNEARCEWVAFLDSDDYWLPHHLRRIVNAIEATRGEAALYFSDVQRPPDMSECRHWDLCGFGISGPFELKYDAGEWALMRIQPMMFQSSVIRRTTYLEIGGLPEQMRTMEDTLLFFKLALLYPACAVSGCGTIMTSDDNIRLTQVYDSESLIYWHTSCFLIKEVLASANSISRDRRKCLIDSLSASYFSIGRIFLRRKNYLSVIKNLSISCFISPSMFAKEFLGSLGRRVLKREKGSASLLY
jgi:glycosyltransferase involved in cell wall biosynthesis